MIETPSEIFVISPKRLYAMWEFYIIKRKLHGRLEIGNFFSRVEKYVSNFVISSRPCNILYILMILFFCHILLWLWEIRRWEMEIKERARDSLSKVLSEICYSDISLEIPKYVKMFTSFSRLYRKSPPPPPPDSSCCIHDFMFS